MNLKKVWLVCDQYNLFSKRLQSSGLKTKFVTNTTKEPMRTLYDRLMKLGFNVKRSEIFTSLTAARGLVEQKQVRPLLLLEETAKEDFEGIHYVINLITCCLRCYIL